MKKKKRKSLTSQHDEQKRSDKSKKPKKVLRVDARHIKELLLLNRCPFSADLSDPIELLGQGGFAHVFLVKRLSSGEEFALKVWKKQRGTFQMLEELTRMKTLHHENIVRVFGMKILEHDRWGMVMEFCGTSLETIIASNHGQGLPRSLAQDVIASIAKTLNFLHVVHDPPLMHRDIKPGNIFIKNGIVKLSDFGTSRQCLVGTTNARSLAGTLHYSDPVAFINDTYGPYIDWWALGVLACELMAGTRPIDSFMDILYRNTIFQRKDENVLPTIEIIESGIPKTLDKNARQLIVDMLQPEPKKRLCTLEGLKSHPFMDNYKFS